MFRVKPSKYDVFWKIELCATQDIFMKLKEDMCFFNEIKGRYGFQLNPSFRLYFKMIKITNTYFKNFKTHFSEN